MKIISFFLLLILLPTLLFSREINIDKLIDKATKEHKHLFVFLHWTNCVYCQEMITFTLQDDSIQKTIKKDFLYIDVNTAYKDIVIYKNIKRTSKEFVKYIGFGYPTSLFFDKNKTIVGLFPGVYNSKEFLVVLKYISSETYKKMNFDDYQISLDFKKKD